jgi:glycosyltransferase involved in cell wall biosynthesis
MVAIRDRSLRVLEVAASGTVGTDDMGPVSRTICTLANGLASLGHAVLVADAPGAPRAALIPGVAVVTVRASWIWLEKLNLPLPLQWARRCFAAFGHAMRLMRRLRLRQFDIVHVHDELLAFALCLLSRARCVYTSHSTTWALESEQHRPLRIGQRLERFIESFAIRRSLAAVAFAGYLQRSLPEIPITTIPGGLQPEHWRPLARPVARAALGIGADQFVVAFVGRIHHNKGVDILVEAVRCLAHRLSTLQVVAIGPLGGQYHSRLPSRYAKQVMTRARGLPIEFTGFLSRTSEPFRCYLSACDIAVFPSRVEPFGYAAIEALAMSAPVVASRTGGLADIVTPDVGVLVPPGNALALADAIEHLCVHREQLERLRANASRRVADLYSQQQFVQRYAALFAQHAVAPSN